jgi:hypothetical protein
MILVLGGPCIVLLAVCKFLLSYNSRYFSSIVRYTVAKLAMTFFLSLWVIYYGYALYSTDPELMFLYPFWALPPAISLALLTMRFLKDTNRGSLVSAFYSGTFAIISVLFPVVFIQLRLQGIV